jgi:phosphoribosylformylglycinamidine synthase
MTLAVPPERVEELLQLAARREVEATVLGHFTAERRLHVLWGEETVALLDMDFLHDGNPPLHLAARWQAPVFDDPPDRPVEHGRTLIDLAGRLNLAANETLARHYDHEVKGLAVVRPFVGVGADVPAEATVFLARHGSLRGLVLSEGVNPFLSDLDPAAMAAAAVDEAVRRQLCAGARLDRIAALDNFCWPDPVVSEQTPDGAYKLAQLVRACRGLYETTTVYGVPLISGKDSMKNEAVIGGVKISVPPTLLVSAIGQIDDVRECLTLDFKRPGDVLFVLGDTGEHTGGSEYFRYLGERADRRPTLGEPAPFVGSRPPSLEPRRALELYRAFERARRAGLVRSAAAPGKGGLALALARSALAGNLGASIDLARVPGGEGLEDDVVLYSESLARLLVTVDPAVAEEFQGFFPDLPCRRIGEVTAAPDLVVVRGKAEGARVGLDELRASYSAGARDA